MNVRFETYNYEEGNWAKTTPPCWFVEAASSDDLRVALASYGFGIVQEFEFVESTQIYRTRSGKYCVLFFDAVGLLCGVFIDAISDYIRFRADVIAPIASLMDLDSRLGRP